MRVNMIDWRPPRDWLRITSIDAHTAGELVRKADGSMYAAKSQGKNCVRLYGEDRRSYRRIGAHLEGKFCVLAAEYHPLTTINVSQGGLRFLVDRQIPAGTLMDVVLMPAGEPELMKACRYS